MTPVRVRIKLWHGQWYASATGGDRKGRHLRLVKAINFCNRLNSKATPKGEESNHG